MFTGTVIQDLMAIVDRAEQRAERQQSAVERELREIFAMRIPINESDAALLGAA